MVDLDFAYSERPNVIKFLQDDYGIEFVASIGTVSEFGVKSGLKDVCRYYEIPFGESNEITGKISEWFDKPDLSFKDIDKLAESEDVNDKNIYSEYCELENKYKEVFRLARKFEGIAKNVGIHASGVLVTPAPINDYVPTRVVDGLAVTLYSGTTLEQLNFIELCEV